MASALVYEKTLISLNSISKVIESLSAILGPMVGGIIFAVLDMKYFILINLISFVISALLQMFINFSLNYTYNAAEKNLINFYKNIKEGFVYLKNQKNIHNMITAFIALNFFIGLSINVPMPFIINSILKLDSKTFAVIQSSFSVGMIFGAIMIKKVIEKISYNNIIKSANILLSVCMIAIGFSFILSSKLFSQELISVYFVIIMILTGVSISFIDIPIFYFIQKTTPDEFRGRVLSLSISISKIFLPIALIISGLLITLLPTYLLSIIGGIFLCIFAIFYIKTD